MLISLLKIFLFFLFFPELKRIPTFAGLQIKMLIVNIRLSVVSVLKTNGLVLAYFRVHELA